MKRDTVVRTRPSIIGPEVANQVRNAFLLWAFQAIADGAELLRRHRQTLGREQLRIGATPSRFGAIDVHAAWAMLPTAF